MAHEPGTGTGPASNTFTGPASRAGRTSGVAGTSVNFGAAAAIDFTVGERDTASSVGSGVVEVLGTPVLIAWLEAATLQVVPAPEGMVSLGVRVDIEHSAPSAVGARVRCTATLVALDGRRMGFRVIAHELPPGSQLPGRELAAGIIDRVLVDRQRFLGALAAGG